MTSTVRYYQNGWHHAVPVRKGYKWYVVRDLSPSRRNKDGIITYAPRVRRIRTEDVRPGMWESK